MEAIQAGSLLTQPDRATGATTFNDLGSDDFLRLLIAQIRNQDPLEPVGNDELLNQIASIRDIELSTTLTESLRSLSGQQRFASASSLIGQFVSGRPDESGLSQEGVVVGVRFTEQGEPILQLAGGGELPIDQVGTIQSSLQAAEALMGQAVVGVDRRDPGEPQVVQGVVTGVRLDPSMEVMLELDTGQDLRFRDFVSLASVEAI